MVPLVLFLAVVVVALAVVAWRLRAISASLDERLKRAAPYLIGSDAPPEITDILLGLGDWVEIARGGNTNPGRIANLDFCPCQSEYRVATNQVVINAWPNPAQVAACNNAPPAANPPAWTCADDCVQVQTHVWHGWAVVQNVKNGQLKFNCETFAQYHCKKPDDPDRNKPPKQTDPNDPEL